MSTMVKQLTAMDAAFLYQETAEVPMHVGSITVFKLPDNYQGSFYETFKQRIAERMHLAPVLSWKLQNAPFDLDHPSWVEDEHFNIDRHIFRGSLPEPRNRATAERIVGWIHAKLLNRARPLWELHVYEGLENNEIITYMKIHHACIDGGAGSALMQILYDVTPLPDGVPALQPSASDPAVPATGTADLATGIPEMGSALFNSYMQMWQQPLKLMTQWPEMLKALPPLLTRLADPRALGELMTMTSPPTPLNRAISSERSFAGTTLSLARVKAIAAKSGGKVNDVVLALSSGILRRYLLETGALPAQSLTAMIPVSLRQQGDAEANNQVMAMISPLATNIEDPKTRLGTIIAESTKAKEMINPFKALMPLYTSGTMLGAPIAVQIFAVLYSRSNLANVLTPMANVVISNVAGSRVPLYAAGAEMLHLYPVSIAAHGLGLNITVQSYLDNMDFGLIAGANILADVRQLTDMLPFELESLEEAYGIKDERVADAIA